MFPKNVNLVNIKAYFNLRHLVYLFWFGRLHWINSVDFDLIPFFPAGRLTLWRYPLNNWDSGRRFDMRRLRRCLWPRQRDLFRFEQKLRRIIRGYRRATVFFPFCSSKYMTPAAVRHIAAKNAGNEASGLRTCH